MDTLGTSFPEGRADVTEITVCVAYALLVLYIVD